MSEEERFKLENELLMTKSKAQMINLYLDKLDQLQQKENIIKELFFYNKLIMICIIIVLFIVLFL